MFVIVKITVNSGMRKSNMLYNDGLTYWKIFILFHIFIKLKWCRKIKINNIQQVKNKKVQVFCNRGIFGICFALLRFCCHTSSLNSEVQDIIDIRDAAGARPIRLIFWFTRFGRIFSTNRLVILTKNKVNTDRMVIQNII